MLVPNKWLQGDSSPAAPAPDPRRYVYKHVKTRSGKDIKELRICEQ